MYFYFSFNLSNFQCFSFLCFSLNIYIYIHVFSYFITCQRRPDEHRTALHDGGEPHGAGEALRSHQVHQRLEQDGAHHPEGEAEEHGVHHHPAVALDQRTQQVTHAVIQHGEAEEVLDPRPDPAWVGQKAHGRPSEHVHKSQDGQQEGRPILVHAVVFGVRREEDDRCEEAQEHDYVSRQVDEEPAVLEERQIQIPIDHLPGRGLLRQGTYYAKITYVTLDHKTSHKSQYFEIEIYTSSESWISFALMYGLWYDNIWLRYNYLKIWNLRVQKNQNIEKITFKVVQMKFLAMHITNQKYI